MPGIAAVAGWLLVAGYVGTLALYAHRLRRLRRDADHGHRARPAPLSAGLAALVLVVFLAVNLGGAKTSGATELAVVAIKLAILAVFAVAGLRTAQASHFQPLFDRGFLSPFTAAALIFVAYEGFELIPNAIDEMEDPQRNLRRALIIAILATTVIYIVVALAALGNLTAAEIEHDQEYVLAVAARPTMGEFGFVLIGIAALLSTASAINATLFGAARLGMVMATEHVLPRVFSLSERRRAVPWLAMLALTVAAPGFTLAAPLDVISTFASATFLLIFFAINLSAWRLRRRIGLAAHLAARRRTGDSGKFRCCCGTTYPSAPRSLSWIAAVYAAAIVTDIALTVLRGAPSRQLRFTNPIITNKITAPMVALTIAAMMPLPMCRPTLRQQPAADEGADDADDDIADQAEAHALDDQAGEPAGNRTDDNENDQAFERHRISPPVAALLPVATADRLAFNRKLPRASTVL